MAEKLQRGAKAPDETGQLARPSFPRAVPCPEVQPWHIPAPEPGLVGTAASPVCGTLSTGVMLLVLLVGMCPNTEIPASVSCCAGQMYAEPFQVEFSF